MSNQIDECSQDDQDADDFEPKLPSARIKNSDSLSLSNKSMRDHVSEGDPLGNLSEGEKTAKEKVLNKIGSGGFFDEINSMKAREEPKSGLLRSVKMHNKRNSSFLWGAGGSALKRKEIGKLSHGSSMNSMMS